jgi:putative membrane protein
MIKLLVRWVVIAVSLWVAVLIVPGLHYEGSGVELFIIAAIFGLVNAVIRPIVLLLSCPLVVLTFGLFILVVNTLMLSLTIWLSSLFNFGITSEGFWATFLGAVVISIVSGILNLFLKDRDDDTEVVIFKK